MNTSLTIFGRAVAGLCAMSFAFFSGIADAQSTAKKKKTVTKKRAKAPAAQVIPAYVGHPLAIGFINEMVNDHQFDRKQLETLFSSIKRNDRVIELMDAPLRRPAMWHEYIPRFMSDERINNGVAYAKQNAEVLRRAETEFGVPKEIIVAIIGVETFYGRITGGFNVLDALATLAFDYPRRAEFFRGELKNFLLLNRASPNVTLFAKGSFAGAMGFPQFMPGSYRDFALDYNNDARTDLWGSPDDIIGSVANYFVKHGWLPGQPVWSALNGFAANQLPPIEGGMSAKQTVGALRALGVPTTASVNDNTDAAILMLEEQDAMKYFVAYNNWFVITRYNRSRLYASSVYTLAEAIRARL
jgi:membrane-bound lytic murein transglycosylase B